MLEVASKNHFIPIIMLLLLAGCGEGKRFIPVSILHIAKEVNGWLSSKRQVDAGGHDLYLFFPPLLFFEFRGKYIPQKFLERVRHADAINLSQNNLSSFRVEIAMRATKLDLSHNTLTEFPNIFAMSSLVCRFYHWSQR